MKMSPKLIHRTVPFHPSQLSVLCTIQDYVTSANIELKNQFLALVPDLMKGYNGALSLAHTTHSKFTVPHLYAGVKQVGKGVSSRVSVDK